VSRKEHTVEFARLSYLILVLAGLWIGVPALAQASEAEDSQKTDAVGHQHSSNVGVEQQAPATSWYQQHRAVREARRKAHFERLRAKQTASHEHVGQGEVSIPAASLSEITDHLDCPADTH
jgi:hypothetical protein